MTRDSSNTRELGRALSDVERGEQTSFQDKERNAFRIGVTGAPGVGKSLLTDRLIDDFVGKGRKVGALLTDPSSPVTQGALLGDRIRLKTLEYGENAFVRSVASRGHPGGLTPTTAEMAGVLDSAGFDPILIESVGIGQNQTDIIDVADCVVLVTGPEQGDEVQMLKAGILEVAHIFVVNKSDLPGADRAAALLKENVTERPDGWKPPVCLVSALNCSGIDELILAIDHRRGFVNGNSQAQ